MKTETSNNNEANLFYSREASLEDFAAAILTASASLADHQIDDLPLKPTVEVWRESLHELVLNHAVCSDQTVYPDFLTDGFDIAWIPPTTQACFRDLASKDDLSLMLLAQGLKKTSLPTLGEIDFMGLQGNITRDHLHILKTWSAAVSTLIEDRCLPAQKVEGMFEEIFSSDLLQEVTSIAEIDDRIVDVVDRYGVHQPAVLGSLLLRNTGLVDGDTYALGMREDHEYIAGIPYALVLAELAIRAKLPTSSITLQDAYAVLLESGLRGQAAAIASGAAIDGQKLDPNAPQFVVYHPDAIHKAAQALHATYAAEGGFAAVLGAADLLRDDCSVYNLDASRANADAEVAFTASTTHDEDVVREVLSGGLIEYLPLLAEFGETPKDASEGKVVATRLTQALHAKFPEAAPITLEARNTEISRRLMES